MEDVQLPPSSQTSQISNKQQEIISLLEDSDGEGEGADEPMAELDEDNPLRNFLSSSMLATDTQSSDDKDEKATPKVTISTCHAAKGLEWPVVFVPAGQCFQHNIKTEYS
jgi:DNA helicase-2/ATP-dependent DNA helicase PcrA